LYLKIEGSKFDIQFSKLNFIYCTICKIALQ